MAAQLHFGSGDSTTFGTTDANTATSASFKRAKLSNMQIGDLLVAYIHCQSGATSQTITAPSGWTAVGPAPGSPSWPTTRLARLYYYPIKSQADLNNLPATITWSFSVYGSRVACVVARATGIDLDAVVDVAATSVTAGTSNSTSLSIAGVTTVNTTTLLVGALYHHNSASTTDPSTASFMTSFSEYLTTATTSIANSGVALGYKTLSSAGATGAIAATFSSAATASGGFLVAFKAASWTAPSPVGQSIHYTSATDTLSTGAAWFTSATDTLKVPAEVRYFPTGYTSITDMLAQSPFYIAHRGGDNDWPEMSLYAYTQAAFWGAPALEVSLQRSSDGVWFGLHDDTLDRTSGTSSFTAADHTWAEIQAYAISAAATTDPSQPAQPYMTLDEVVNAYYMTHPLMIDAKNNNTYFNELLDILDALPGTPTDRIMAKSYGPDTGWAVAAAARGYKTWGYFYDVNAAVIPTYQSYYDVLGLEYGAASSTWTTIKSYGKPVIAHTIVSPTDATTALAKGAAGMMISGVEEVVPRP